MGCLRVAFPEVLAIYRFGSWSTGLEWPGSDIDLAVLTPHPVPGARCWEIAQQLAALAGRDVDLVDLRAASTVMSAQIVSQGERVYCADGRRCDEYEDYVYSAYARLNEERREILRDIQERGSIYG